MSRRVASLISSTRNMSRQSFDRFLLLAAVLAAGYAVWQLRLGWARGPEGAWLWWFLAGSGLLGGAALVRMKAWLPDAQSAPGTASFPGRRRRRAGLICVVVGLLLIAWVVLRLWPNYRLWHGTLEPWIVALGLVLFASWLIGPVGQTDGQPGSQDTSKPRALRWNAIGLEALVFLLIAALAVFLRLYRLDSIPAGIFVDETNGGLDALYILEGRDASPFATGWYETPNGYVYYLATLFKLLGVDYYSLKAASLIPALLTVPAVYLLGRYLFGPAAGLGAMFFMAVSRWHLTLSRWAWNDMWPPFFLVLSAYFLIKGLRERLGLFYALGGLLSGLMVYTYLSSRLAVLALGLFGLYWVLTNPDGPVSGWKRNWRGLAVFLLAFVVTVAPLSVTYIRDPFTFANRSSQVNIFSEIQESGSYSPLLDNVWNHIRLFYQVGDPNGRHNLPGEPQTDPFTGVLMIVGLGYGLLNLRDSRQGTLWLWLIVALSAGYLTSLRDGPPNSYRALIALPAVALLAGDALARMVRGLGGLMGEHYSSRAWTRVARLVCVVLLGGAALWEAGTYFGRQAESPAVQGAFNLTETSVANDVASALREDTTVYLSPRLHGFSPMRFLVYGEMKKKGGANTLDRPPYFLLRPEVDLPVPDTGQDALLLLDGAYWPVIDYVRYFYPGAQIEPARGADQGLRYVRVRVPRAEVAALQGVTARISSAGGSAEERFVTEINQDLARDGAVEWRASIRAERSGVYDFTNAGDMAVTVDGERWTEKRFLGAGLHAFEVKRASGGASGPLGWQPPGAPAQTIPPKALFRVNSPQVGLTGSYYGNEGWQGAPLFRQITPFFLLAWPEREPVGGPFSARFTGSISIEKPGPYRFRINADDGARLIIDGALVGEGLVPDKPNQVVATVQMSAGSHEIQIDYFQRGGGNALEFYWQPPGGNEAPVPPAALAPSKQNP